jgi:two-component sensor histidine kinase
MFRESQNRVYAMALVHELLYESPNLSEINFARYIERLSSNWLNSYSVNPGATEVKFELDDVYLGIELAIPCALLVNELASNALKHGFPDGRRGEIRIGLRRDLDQVVLTVADTGVGLPDESDFRVPQSLGMQLVHTLVDQIDGEIALALNGGTEFTVRFRESEAESV